MMIVDDDDDVGEDVGIIRTRFLFPFLSTSF